MAQNRLKFNEKILVITSPLGISLRSTILISEFVERVSLLLKKIRTFDYREG